MKSIGHRIEYYFKELAASDDYQETWPRIRHSSDASLKRDECMLPLWLRHERIPFGGWEELDNFYDELLEFGITQSGKRAGVRENQLLKLNGKSHDPEDSCYYKFKLGFYLKHQPGLVE